MEPVNNHDTRSLAERVRKAFLVGNGQIEGPLAAELIEANFASHSDATRFWEVLDPVLANFDARRFDWQFQLQEKDVVLDDWDKAYKESGGDVGRFLWPETMQRTAGFAAAIGKEYVDYAECRQQFYASFLTEIFDDDVAESYLLPFPEGQHGAPTQDPIADKLAARRFVQHHGFAYDHSTHSAIASAIAATCRSQIPSAELGHWLGDVIYALQASLKLDRTDAMRWELCQRLSVVRQLLEEKPDDCWTMAWAGQIFSLHKDYSRAQQYGVRLLESIHSLEAGVVTGLFRLLCAFPAGGMTDLGIPGSPAVEDRMSCDLGDSLAETKVSYRGRAASLIHFFIDEACRHSKISREFIRLMALLPYFCLTPDIVKPKCLREVPSSLWITGALILRSDDPLIDGDPISYSNCWLTATSAAMIEENEFDFLFAATNALFCTMHINCQDAADTITAIADNALSEKGRSLAKSILSRLVACKDSLNPAVTMAVAASVRKLWLDEVEISDDASDILLEKLSPRISLRHHEEASEMLCAQAGEEFRCLPQNIQSLLINGVILFRIADDDAEPVLKDFSPAVIQMARAIERLYVKSTGEKGSTLGSIVAVMKQPGKNPNVHRKLLSVLGPCLAQMAAEIDDWRKIRDDAAHGFRRLEAEAARTFFDSMLRRRILERYLSTMRRLSEDTGG